MLELCDDDSGDHHRNPHHDGADVQHGLTADFVNDSHGRKGRHKENHTSHTGGEQSLCTTCKSETLENLASVVDDGVDTAIFVLVSCSFPCR